MNNLKKCKLNSFVYFLLCALSWLQFYSYSWNSIFKSFWLDELATVWLTSGSLNDAIFNTSPFPSHPAYYFILYIWVNIFGTFEAEIRSFSVLCFFFSIILMRSFLENLLEKRDIFYFPLIFASFMASEEILHQSINARAYSMGILMAIISMNSTLSFAKKGSVKDLLYSIIAVVILLLCNPFFAPVIVVNYSILLAYSCNNLRLVITHLKWSLVVLIIIGILGLYKSYYLTWNRVDEIYVGWISNFQIIDVILTAASSSIFITTACIIACAILFNRYRVLSGRNVKLGFLFSVVLIVSPYILSISLSKIAGYNLFLPRYLILSNVGFVLIICLIFSILKSTQFKMAVFVLLFAVSHINAKTSLHEEDWRGAVEYIRDEHQKIGKNIPFVYISLGHSESHSDHRLQTRQQVNGWSAPLLIYAKKMEFEVEHDYLPLPLFTERSSYRENLKLELAQKIANNQLEKFYVIVDGRIQITDDKIASLLLINSLKSDFRIISKSFAGDIRVIAFYR